MTVVAQFELSYYRVIDEAGNLATPLPHWATDFEALKFLYGIMVKTRLFDKKAIALQRTGKIGTYAPINGQEAVSTAIGHAMHREDVFVPYYRDYAAQFQRGVLMSDILAYWGGDERGSAYINNTEDLPICVPIASQCLHATGIGFAIKYRKQNRVVVVCIGDGGTSEGDFYEALNIAGTWKLPIVFVINNNRWAISVPLFKQTAATKLAQKAIAGGFEGVEVDGNDVVACRDKIGEAIDKARRGEGPTLIEALTYRLSDHTTADDATRYQPKEEVETAQRREPIARLKLFLEQQGQWNDSQENKLLDTCNQEIKLAVDEFLAKPKQPVSAIFDYHYATLPDYLVEQRATAVEEGEVSLEEAQNA